jgi:Domain of unknown function (DUF4145)
MQLNPPLAGFTCPHCGVAFNVGWKTQGIGLDSDAQRYIWHALCLTCGRQIIMLVEPEINFPAGLGSTAPAVVAPPEPKTTMRLVYPKAVARQPVPATVPAPIADDYNEACLVLPDSAKASAALSRRCLQSLLVAKAGAKKKDLFDQIQEVLDASLLPSDLAEDLDTVRVIGAFGAHPIKGTRTGEIVPVEPGEAEWNLDVVEDLFDFFYARAERRAEKRAALDAKFAEAGKPLLADIRKKKPDEPSGHAARAPATESVPSDARPRWRGLRVRQRLVSQFHYSIGRLPMSRARRRCSWRSTAFFAH